MVDDIDSYCKSCPTCAMSKPNNQQPMGLLQTLPVPRRPWQYIGIDFVGPLPESKTRHGSFDMICVIIDHLTSMVHLVPTRQNYGAKQIAEVVFDTVYKLHGLPERIISDRDSLFTSTFWRRLNELLGVELRLSTAYHPQTDGMTERANRTMTQMLRQCVQPDQKD
jgi:transposase InsO family protein